MDVVLSGSKFLQPGNEWQQQLLCYCKMVLPEPWEVLLQLYALDGVRYDQGLEINTWGLQRHPALAFCRCVPLCLQALDLSGLKTLAQLQRFPQLAAECLEDRLLPWHPQTFGATSTHHRQPQRSGEQAAGAASGTAPRRLQVMQQTAESSAWQHTHKLEGAGRC